jgi:hypothetical protein
MPTAVAGYTEAESYSDKISWGWSNVLNGSNGNGYMEFADSVNMIDWSVTKSQNETDTVTIRYANTDTINKPCIILINGTNAGEILFSPTQSLWSSVKKVVPFIKGANTIQLVSLASKPGAYIDRYSLSTSPVLFLTSDTANLCPGDNIFFTNGNQGNNVCQWQSDSGKGYTNITDTLHFAEINGDTLFLIAPHTNWYGTTFRCLVNGIVTGKEFTLQFASNWTGAIDTRWERPANWSCGSLPDAYTDVKIGAGLANYPVVNMNTSCRSVHVTGSSSGVIIKTGETLLIEGGN